MVNHKKQLDAMHVLNHGSLSEREAEWKDMMSEDAPKSPLELRAMIDQWRQDQEIMKIAPDTAGTDYFFLETFVNDMMIDEFWIIATAFLKECYQEIPEYAALGWAYPEWDIFQNFDGITYGQILNLVLNGARSGSEYCRELLKYLYKTYYKREYNQLKRFHKVSMQDVFNMVCNDDYTDRWGNTARILTMCEMMEISMEGNCGTFYRMLNEERERREVEPEMLTIEDELRKECKAVTDAWQEAEKAKPEDERDKKYWEVEDFLAECLRYNDLPADFLWRSEMMDYGMNRQTSTVLALLKMTYPDREFTYEDVQYYAHLFELVNVISNFDWAYRETMVSLLGLHEQEFPGMFEGRILFKPETVLAATHRSSAAKPAPKAPVITHMAPIATAQASDADYKAEISELRRKLHEQEQQSRYLREQYQTMKEELKEAEAQVEGYKRDREELIALREHVYRESQEMPEAPVIDLDTMKKAIGEHSILIVGGHVNWQNRLKQNFPKWKFIDIHYYNTVDVKVVEGVEKVYFFTDYLSHITYRMMINVIRDKGVPFGYVANINMERMVRQIYEDMEG